MNMAASTRQPGIRHTAPAIRGGSANLYASFTISERETFSYEREAVRSTLNARILYDRSERAAGPYYRQIQMPRKELVVRLALMQLLLHHALVATVARHDHFHLIFQKQLHFLQGN